MEATAIIPTLSPPNPLGGQTQTGRSGDDNSFAPVLSHAVAGRNRSHARSSAKSSAKTAAAQPGKKAAHKSTRGSVQTEKTRTTENLVDGPSASTEENKSASSSKDKTSEKHQTNTSLKVDLYPETAPTDQTADPTFLLPAGGSEALLNLPKGPPLSDLQKTVATVPDILLSGKQDSPNLADLAKGTSTGKQSINVSPSDFLQQTGLQKTQLVSANGDTAIPGTGSYQSSPSPNSITSISQNTSVAQQLENILTANGAVVQQSPPLDQSNQLDSLSAPLFTFTSPQDQKAAAVPDSSSIGALAASLPQETTTGDKISEKPSTRLENDFNKLLFTKADAHDPKDSTKVQEKDATLNNTENGSQSTLPNSSSSTNTTGNTQQIGQFAFGSTLLQNVQTGQHTTAATATTGTNYLTPSTAAQENALINQVMQNFQINSTSTPSKLVIKLYPEELGELKIDIQMKDGAIKANIVTQTEQVQKVIEKYIPKLKSFMEQQGLTIDDILVTNTSDNVGGHDLFQKDFTDNHDFSPPGKSAKSASFIDISFEKAFSKTTDAASGVNVTV